MSDELEIYEEGGAVAATCDLPTMSEESVAAVRELEAAVKQMPQLKIVTEHVFHAGLYGRTILMPAGTVLVGVQIQIPTVLIIAGDCEMLADEGPVRFAGYHVTRGQAGRKAGFFAHKDTWLTMLFATDAKTVEEAENQFTNEPDNLGSRRFA